MVNRAAAASDFIYLEYKQDENELIMCQPTIINRRRSFESAENDHAAAAATIAHSFDAFFCSLESSSSPVSPFPQDENALDFNIPLNDVKTAKKQAGHKQQRTIRKQTKECHHISFAHEIIEEIENEKTEEKPNKQEHFKISAQRNMERHSLAVAADLIDSIEAELSAEL